MEKLSKKVGMCPRKPSNLEKCEKIDIRKTMKLENWYKKLSVLVTYHGRQSSAKRTGARGKLSRKNGINKQVLEKYFENVRFKENFWLQKN